MDSGYQLSSLTLRPTGSDAPQQAAHGGHANVWQIFLSSTIKDLDDYRRQVQDALLRQAQVACFLSEDWVGGYESTVEKCRDEIGRACGFIGIFAFWYGSVPPGHTQSITHLEFKWALEKWKQTKHPPIAVLVPKSPSAAEKRLREKARALIPPDAAKQKEHAELLDRFQREVTQPWLFVNDFKDQYELREKVIVICLQWRLGRPLDAATGGVEVIEKNAQARRVTPEEWGLLGRGPQLSAFDKLLSRAGLYKDVPAVAALVHGGDDAGQRFFLRQLLTKKRLRAGRPPQPGTPQSEQYDVKALTQWAGQSLGVLPDGKEVASPEELAELVAEELESQQLSLVLDQVYLLAGGAAAFQEEFWRPLYARLAELRKQKQLSNRLIAVVVDYSDLSGLPESVAAEFDPAAAAAEDYARLMMLPRLGDITDGELMEWFDELDVPDDAQGRRARLANVALKRAGAGAAGDGTPLRVYDRLNNEVLWPEGEDQ